MSGCLGARQADERAVEARAGGPVGRGRRYVMKNGMVRAYGWRATVSGVMSFFRGNGTNVIKVTPETAVKFGTYEYLANSFRDRRRGGEIQNHERFIAGAGAGMVAQTTIYPLEIVKTRMAVSKVGTYAGISHCMFKVSRQEGPLALYHGAFDAREAALLWAWLAGVPPPTVLRGSVAHACPLGRGLGVSCVGVVGVRGGARRWPSRRIGRVAVRHHPVRRGGHVGVLHLA